MKTETIRGKWLRPGNSLLLSPSGRTTSESRNCSFPTWLLFPVLLPLIAGLFGCSPTVQSDYGGGTSTEVVGRIVSPDNRSVQGAHVLLLDTLLKGTNSFVDTIADVTDENGNFRLPVTTSGLYLLTAKDTVGRSFMDEILIADADNHSLSLGNIKVDTMGSLSGFIYDNTNFKANITVILYKKDMPFLYLWRRGAFTIDSLPPGDVRIQIGGWIDDYSRANKWIIFLDSTLQIVPGKETVIDTVFINEATLLKVGELTPDAGSRAPAQAMNSGRNLPFSASPLTAGYNPDIRIFTIVQHFKSDKTVGAAVFLFDKSDISTVPDKTAACCRPKSGMTYYSTA